MSDPVQYLTNERGERTAVLLPMSAYEKLLEDLDDLGVVAERSAFRTSSLSLSSSAMASFEIQWRSSTKKDLRRIPRDDVSHILIAVTKLVDEPLPHGSEKLTGSDHTYCIRVGDYRVVYELLHAVNAVARFNACDTERAFIDRLALTDYDPHPAIKAPIAI